MSPRWQKLRRDAGQYRGRLAMMVVAVAVSVFGMTAVLTAFSILRREIQTNYRSTRPASATIITHGVPPVLLAEIRRRPDVAAAEIRQTVEVRARTADGSWQSMLLFVVPDFRRAQIGTVEHLAGPVTPGEGTVLLERTSGALLGNTKTVVLLLPDGRRPVLLVSGTVHDRSLPPATMEKTGYGFITPRTLATLHLPAPDDALRLLAAPAPYADAVLLRAVAQNVAQQLARRGVVVDQVQVPPPGTHSHQLIMEGILALLLVFSLLTMVLSGVLVSTLLNGLLAGQTRQIGVMKTLGATTPQLAGLYLTLVGSLSVVAVGLGVGPGLGLGRLVAERMADMLNFTVVSRAVPLPVLGAVAFVGFLVPLALAWGPVRRATRLSVRSALADFGAAPTAAQRGRVDQALGQLPGISRPLLVSLQNALRQRRRLLLTLGLLSAAGAMFLTALTLLNSWTRTINDAFARRRYNQEVWVSRPVATDSLLRLARAQSGVRTAEAWNLRPAVFGQPGQPFVVASTYADQRHGSLYVVVAPSGSRLLDMTLAEGRWLVPTDTTAVVLNPAALAQAPAGTRLGSTVWLAAEGGPLRGCQVVGLAREVATPASLYLTAAGLRRLAVRPNTANVLRLAATPAAAASLETALQRAGHGIWRRWATADYRSAVSDHIYIFVGALLFMAALMAVVGLLGLAATMSTGVVERTREFGVMRTLGASPRTVRQLVLFEGLLIAGASCFVALALAVPMAALLCRMIGTMAFRTPLTLTLHLGPWVLWLGLVTFFAAVATLAPARQAVRRSVRAALSYE
ncbi:ABC transporter permease [Hymenobacter sp.]|uniref:ABC transporter permease n=1 Tax=Hymenobacter sp. TaxID=1898978 RepID=UPI00286AF19D|nr:ABC transporter permease [Hymenobacter sp.]